MLRFLLHLALGVVCVGLNRRYGLVGLSDLSVWLFFLLLCFLASGELLLKAGRAEAEADLGAAVLVRRLQLMRVQGSSFRDAVIFLAAGRTGESDPFLVRLAAEMEAGRTPERAARNYARRIGSPLARHFLPRLAGPLDPSLPADLERAEDAASLRAAPHARARRSNGLLLIQGFWLSVAFALYLFAAWTLYQYIQATLNGIHQVIKLGK